MPSNSSLIFAHRGMALLLSGRARPVRFALTGGTAGLLQLCVLSGLAGVGWPNLLANGAAFLLATQANFFLSGAFTWRDRPAAVSGLPRRWAAYHGAVVGTALLNMAVFAAGSPLLPPLAAAALGILVAAGANFATGDRLVFRDPDEAPGSVPSIGPPVPLRLFDAA